MKRDPDTILALLEELKRDPTFKRQMKDIGKFAGAFYDQMMDHIAKRETDYLDSWDLREMGRLLLDPDKKMSKDAAAEMAYRVYVCSKYLSAPLNTPLLTATERMALTDAALDIIFKFSKVMVGISLIENMTPSGNS